MKRRDFVQLCASSAVLAAPGLARAQTPVVWKASDVHPLGYPTVEAVENMGKKLEKATNGRLSVQMYASMQLGGSKEAIEQAQVGAIQFARVSVGALGPVIDELNVFNMPYLFRSTAHMQKVIDGPIGQELMDKVTNNPKAGLVALAWMDTGARSLYDTKKPIRNIADLKGMKFRVMGARCSSLMNALGGNGVSMGYDQVQCLQTGVVDGARTIRRASCSTIIIRPLLHADEHLIVGDGRVRARRTPCRKDDQALLIRIRRGRKPRTGAGPGTRRTRWTRRRPRNHHHPIADKKPFRTRSSRCGTNSPKYADMIKRIQAVQ